MPGIHNTFTPWHSEDSCKIPGSTFPYVQILILGAIYIHIPYCKQACHYCDFHFSTKKETKDAFINSLLTEISLRSNYLGGEQIETVYFGGGTPSLLSGDELKRIFEAMDRHFFITGEAEITLEANPDDLTPGKISSLKSSPVNRLSIGVQSFFDKDLKWMNRAHHAEEAVSSVKRAQDAGFENISIDLIYGLPDSTNEEWNENLDKAFSSGVQHLSCYSLTVEPRTALARFIATGKSKPLNEEQSAQQFEMLMSRIKEQGWLHYEISNFAAEEKFISKHNSGYWKGKKYLGLGPSAHSFDGQSRQWNVPDNRKYIRAIDDGKIPFEKEELTDVQRINERIMTELRTMWGLKIADYEGLRIADLLTERSRDFIYEGYLETINGTLILTDKGKLIADRIILELILEE